MVCQLFDKSSTSCRSYLDYFSMLLYIIAEFISMVQLWFVQLIIFVTLKLIIAFLD